MTDFLMEKEVLVGKYRGLQLPDEGDGYYGDGDDDDDNNDDDDDDEEEEDDNVDDNDNDDGWSKKTLWRNVFNCLAIMIHIVMLVMVTMMMMMVMVMTMVVMMQIKTRKHLVIEGKRKGEMDFEDRASVALQRLTCDLLLCWRFDENLQW